jgi:hypothetical protein
MATAAKLQRILKQSGKLPGFHGATFYCGMALAAIMTGASCPELRQMGPASSGPSKPAGERRLRSTAAKAGHWLLWHRPRRYAKPLRVTARPLSSPNSWPLSISTPDPRAAPRELIATYRATAGLIGH